MKNHNSNDKLDSIIESILSPTAEENNIFNLYRIHHGILHSSSVEQISKLLGRLQELDNLLYSGNGDINAEHIKHDKHEILRLVHNKLKTAVDLEIEQLSRLKDQLN